MGREAFERQAWGDAFRLLSAAGVEQPLGLEDAERLAVAADLVVLEARRASKRATRAHVECVRLGDARRAARCAFWLAFGLLNKGDVARGGGWVDRAQRLLDDARPRLRRAGLPALPGRAARHLRGRRRRRRMPRSPRPPSIGDRFGDAELVTLGPGRAWAGA